MKKTKTHAKHYKNRTTFGYAMMKATKAEAIVILDDHAYVIVGDTLARYNLPSEADSLDFGVGQHAALPAEGEWPDESVMAHIAALLGDQPDRDGE